MSKSGSDQDDERTGFARDAETGSRSASATTGKSANPENLTALLDRMRNDSTGEEPTVGNIVDALGTRAYGPLLFAPAIIALAPTGAIPGMSMITGSLILAIALQMLIGRDQIWMPRRILDVSIARKRLEDAIDWIRPYAGRVDEIVHPRQIWLAKFPITRLIAIICAALAISMFPLAFVPFGAAAPSAALVLFSLGLVIRDGFVILAGFVVAALATWLVVYLI